MAGSTHHLWTFGRLSLAELVRRTARESWQDEVFGQAGRMAFYHFIAIFPLLLVLFSMTARVSYFDAPMKSVIREMSNQVLPNQVSQLFQVMMEELSQHANSRVPVLPVLAGAAWATLNATWAMIFGLNTAYEVKEDRPKLRLGATVLLLSVTLAVTAMLALLLILLGRVLRGKLGATVIALRGAEWIILAVALLLAFAVLYRFAPNLRNARWKWSTPGAVCALLLWVAATSGARIYFGRFNDYSRSYGHLNSAVMLLLWLYVSNAAVLIGGEMNSEIEKSIAEPEGAVDEEGHRRSG
jgi:membrane protein